MRAVGRVARELVRERAAHPARPARVGQHIRPRARHHERRALPGRAGEVAAPVVVELPRERRAREIERIRARAQRRVDGKRRHEQIVCGIAVGVVVDRFAERLQPARIGRGQPGLRGCPGGDLHEVVAIGAHHGPRAMPPGQVTVDDEARANRRRRVDACMEASVNRHDARLVVIEVRDVDAAVEQRRQRGAVRVERDVEHGHGVAAHGRHAREQRDVAFRPGHENRRGRRCEPQLLQRADAVRVAVEYVVALHRSSPRNVT
ncbi:hypothetical protein BUB20358_01769 [Burkholderia ubonensis]|nr:hypothetical protein BUB20358_01769 [Burkholderia ubonensis]